jgi:Fe2+ or Zn2+ uptake regulation protein
MSKESCNHIWALSSFEIDNDDVIQHLVCTKCGDIKTSSIIHEFYKMVKQEKKLLKQN